MTQSFEELMQNLEDLVERLESSELSLEDQIEAYQQAVALAKAGHLRLSEAERRIEEVTRTGERREVSPEELLRSPE